MGKFSFMRRRSLGSALSRPKLADNMFAVVGQPLGEPENIYETIESYASQIERDLLHAVSNLNMAAKHRHVRARDRDSMERKVKVRGTNDRSTKHRSWEKPPKPQPIVIYEEPDHPIRDSDSPQYVLAYQHPPMTEDDTYETIGMVESERVQCKLFQSEQHFETSEDHVMVRDPIQSSTSTLNHPLTKPKLSERTDAMRNTNQPISTDTPVTCQTRMEAVAKKVSLLKGRGQLKLSVYINCGLLTIHVVQARHLSSEDSINCNSYVKLSLVPDDIKRTRCKTEINYSTNSPTFDEKFSFELLEEDLKKRLLVSMWNRDNGHSEFLGCMSFGINHIQSSKRVVNGWYYLLTEDIGRRKHLRVVDRKSGGLPADQQPTKNVSPSAHTDLNWMDRHIVVVRRGGSGYGFTVSGSSPAQVCRLEPGSSAEIAGLQKNDCIVRINGQNVSRTGSDGVAKLVRNAPKQIVLEVQRSRLAREALLSSPWKPTLCSTFLPSPAHSEGEEEEDSFRTASPPPLRLEDLDEHRDRRLMDSGGSVGSTHSSGSGRYYRESLV